MKTLVSMLTIGMVLLGMSAGVSATILLDETFDTNLNGWTLLDTPSPGGYVNVGINGSKLIVELENNARWRSQGVQSIDTYALAAGQKLVFDFYGTNTIGQDGVDTHSYPFVVVAAYANADGCFNAWNSGWVAVKGWDGYFGDWAQSSVIGYADLAGDNATTLKHTIITIDAADINVYIEDDYFENLTNPSSLYTTTTSSVFTAEELQNGLYVNLTGARYTEWYTGACQEWFDGVRVSSIPEPASLCLFAAAVIAGWLRKK